MPKQERKKYIPHVTFVRIKDRRAWSELAIRFEGMWDEPFGSQRVDQIHLVQSELTRTGPEYTILERIDL